MQLNVLAPVLLTQAVIPGMVARGDGGVISVASLLAFSGAWEKDYLPKRAVYAASKSFLVTFTQILASELRDSGVRVQVVCPGLVRSEFHSRQGVDMSSVPRMEPESVARASLSDLGRGVVVSIPGRGRPRGAGGDRRRVRAAAGARPARSSCPRATGCRADRRRLLLAQVRRLHVGVEPGCAHRHVEQRLEPQLDAQGRGALVREAVSINCPNALGGGGGTTSARVESSRQRRSSTFQSRVASSDPPTSAISSSVAESRASSVG